MLQQDTFLLINDLSDLLIAKRTPMFPKETKYSQKPFPFDVFRVKNVRSSRGKKVASKETFSLDLPIRPESAFQNLKGHRNQLPKEPPLLPQVVPVKVKRPKSGYNKYARRNCSDIPLVKDEEFNLREEELKQETTEESIRVPKVIIRKGLRREYLKEDKENIYRPRLQSKKSQRLSIVQPIFRLKNAMKEKNNLMETTNKAFDVTFGIYNKAII